MDYFETLEGGVRKYSEVGKIVIAGDLNARTGDRDDGTTPVSAFTKYIHTIDGVEDVNIDYNFSQRSSMDMHVNSSGNKLLDLCKGANLRIVNGRLYDNTDQYTYLSDRGNSVIDYFIADPSLFGTITQFVIHDLYSCSPHTPIQLSIKANVSSNPHVMHSQILNKLVWDHNKVDRYKVCVQANMHSLQQITDHIVSDSHDNINTGIESFANTLYNTAFSVFGVSRQINTGRHVTKHNSPWFTRECETARADLQVANKAYRSYRCDATHSVLVTKRSVYCKIKRFAKRKFERDRKIRLRELAQNNARQFWSEIRRIRGNANNSPDVSLDDFFDHFKEVYSIAEPFRDLDVETRVSDVLNVDSNNSQNPIEILDSAFSYEEVDSAVGKLKRNKSAGIDLLVPEIFIESRDQLTPLLCQIFNHLYSNCIYPESWTRGIVIPVPKKGDKRDPNNYRGITLTSIFSKIFSQMLDNRLRKWSEENSLLSSSQFGFRKNRSTVDCIFILQSIIDRVIRKRKKLYCAFVDFQKAFDMVYRNGIWYKLKDLGASCKFVQMINKMYQSVKACIRSNGRMSDFFDSSVGVKQGEPLSPILFLIFIDDMAEHLRNNTDADFVTIDQLQIFLLLFADDTALFAETEYGLQSLLNGLHDYCNRWGITVNIGKTKVVVFQGSNRHCNTQFTYANTVLENVTSFTYLGITLSSNGKFFQAQKHLSEQATKAIFSLNSLFDKVQLTITDKLHLFDTMVLPILEYGSEIWGFHSAPDIERVHLKFLKQILKVRNQTCTLAIYGELGRVPLVIKRKERILKYWRRILLTDNSLLSHVFQADVATAISPWVSNVKSLLDNLGFSYLWNKPEVSKPQLNMVIQRVYDQYLQGWFSDVANSRKLSTYKTIKSGFSMEKYFTIVENDNFRIALTRFRCSAHSLEIEEGRFRHIARENRLCRLCNMNVIENEYHFLLVCPFYTVLRRTHLPRYFCSWANTTKFTALMTTENESLLKRLSKYVYIATDARNVHLSSI
ncbi:MAG: reverse transcriptase family protein [Sedimenticola sp.]